MNTQADPKEQICPLCSTLMPMAQLAQLNRTLQMLREEKATNPKRNEWIIQIVNEIERVSKIIQADPCVVSGKPIEGH